MEKNFKKGEKILGDFHYSKLKTSYKIFPWVTRYRKPKSKNLTKEKKLFNTKATSVRNRIERVFASVKNDWFTLSKPWRRSSQSQEHMVKITFAVFNSKT